MKQTETDTRIITHKWINIFLVKSDYIHSYEIEQHVSTSGGQIDPH